MERPRMRARRMMLMTARRVMKRRRERERYVLCGGKTPSRKELDVVGEESWGLPAGAVEVAAGVVVGTGRDGPLDGALGKTRRRNEGLNWRGRGVSHSMPPGVKCCGGAVAGSLKSAILSSDFPFLVCDADPCKEVLTMRRWRGIPGYAEKSAADRISRQKEVMWGGKQGHEVAEGRVVDAESATLCTSRPQ
jgi:hypothetical protein